MFYLFDVVRNNLDSCNFFKKVFSSKSVEDLESGWSFGVKQQKFKEHVARTQPFWIKATGAIFAFHIHVPSFRVHLKNAR